MGSERELADVVRGDDHRLAQQHDAVGTDGELAQALDGVLGARLRLDLALRELVRGLEGQRAQVADVPPDGLDLAGLDVLADQGDRRQAGQLDLAQVAALRQRLGGGRQTDARRAP
ncbi:MAG: hypothetical protein QM708_04190 [Propioniciclava sp.]|uniref:hypothetical protein n=1 Tax=Propioniciclava sp. TaxID=2038686 RepID=UPI0039E2F497